MKRTDIIKQVNIRLTEKQLETLNVKTKEKGFKTISEYIRFIADKLTKSEIKE